MQSTPRDTVQSALQGEHDQSARQAFRAALEPELKRFEDAAATALDDWRSFNREYSKDHDSATVVGFVFQVVSRLVTSPSLLALGHLAISGAAFRQSLEALATAFVMAEYDAPYRRLLWEGKFSVDASVGLLEKQATRDPALNLSAVQVLVRQRSFYSKYSHPTLLAMSDTINLGGGGASLGASFDEAKLPFYRQELDSRSGFAETLPNAMDGVSLRLQKWPIFTMPG